MLERQNSFVSFMNVLIIPVNKLRVYVKELDYIPRPQSWLEGAIIRRHILQISDQKKRHEKAPMCWVTDSPTAVQNKLHTIL